MTQTRPLNPERVRIVGGGLAGCEAAFQLARAGLQVDLHEMKPEKRTPAQVTDHLAELVCSNSFRSNNPENAVGLIKEEMRRAGGFIMACAEVAKVPAGDALAVDRERFALEVEARLAEEENITLHRGEVDALPDDDVATLVCTGPLTSDALAQQIAGLCGQERLAFYDAIAPIVEADSIDMEHAYFASRWGKGEGTDYLNCPMTQAEYAAFYEAMRKADVAAARDFEDLHYFEGCLPIEVLASRGEQTLCFGPLKPVGLPHPETGEQAHAVIQLRREDIHGNAYNLVGCQTRMKIGAQREVFGLVPALRSARFLRFGAIHRNTYLDAPALLDEDLRLKRPAGEGWQNVFFAGQITGVEGYVESTACGFFMALILADRLSGKEPLLPPANTALGGLYRHTRGLLRANPKAAYAPSNVNWSMIPPVPPPPGKKKMKKKDKRVALSQRALEDLDGWMEGRRKSGLWLGETLAWARG
jgi:methylenetetrahydrofolate--tRNA-(uracil-5-)-methyltransferase